MTSHLTFSHFILIMEVICGQKEKHCSHLKQLAHGYLDSEAEVAGGEDHGSDVSNNDELGR